MTTDVEMASPRVHDALEWRPEELLRIRSLLAWRRYWQRVLYPAVAREFESAVDGQEPGTMDEVKAVLDSLPGARRFLALDRYIHLRLWAEVGRVVDQRLGDQPDLLHDAAHDLGALETDTSFDQPEYYAEFDFHRQDGGIWRDDRGALIYALGARVVHVDSKQPYALHDALAARIPDDLEVRTAYDLGCGFGKTTFSVARRFPEAKVIGVDLSAPVLRLGRKLASEQGLEIDWVQADAAAVPRPDGEADLVIISMVLHELPLEEITAVCREAYRLLRPGGLFLALETALTGDPFRDVLGAHHSEITGEPYINAFRAASFAEFALEGGFADVEVLDFRPPGAPASVDRAVWSTPWSLLKAVR
jgi:SAM-dependent methyltransferase